MIKIYVVIDKKPKAQLWLITPIGQNSAKIVRSGTQDDSFTSYFNADKKKITYSNESLIPDMVKMVVLNMFKNDIHKQDMINEDKSLCAIKRDLDLD